MVTAKPIQESSPTGTPGRVIGYGSEPRFVGLWKATPSAVNEVDSPLGHGLKHTPVSNSPTTGGTAWREHRRRSLSVSVIARSRGDVKRTAYCSTAISWRTTIWRRSRGEAARSVEAPHHRTGPRLGVDCPSASAQPNRPTLRGRAYGTLVRRLCGSCSGWKARRLRPWHPAGPDSRTGCPGVSRTAARVRIGAYAYCLEHADPRRATRRRCGSTSRSAGQAPWRWTGPTESAACGQSAFSVRLTVYALAWRIGCVLTRKVRPPGPRRVSSPESAAPPGRSHCRRHLAGDAGSAHACTTRPGSSIASWTWQTRPSSTRFPRAASTPSSATWR